MLNKEKKIINYFTDNYLVFGYIFVTIMALLVRFLTFHFESHDYVAFLAPWFDYLKNNGGILALANYPGNYNAPYMTIMALLTYIPVKSLYSIKFVSILFDFGLALSSASLVKYLVNKKKNLYFFIAYAVTLFLPEVLMNSGIWGQCDSGYTMFIILALLYLLKEKYIVSFIYLGISFALKLQFIFILPLFIVIYIVKKRYSIFHFLIIPLTNIVLCLPAIIIGKPIGELLSIYFGQVNEYKAYMSLNFLNLYSLVEYSGQILYYVGIILTVIVCFLMLFYVIVKKVKFNDQKILNLGLWFVVIVTYLLPCMHERYLYMGGVLAVIYYIVYKKNYLLAVSIIMCTILTYFHYLFGLSLSIGYKAIFSVGYFMVIAFYTKDLCYMLNDKEKKN